MMFKFLFLLSICSFLYADQENLLGNELYYASNWQTSKYQIVRPDLLLKAHQVGYTPASLDYAESLLLGYNFDQNIKESVEIVEKFVKLGNPRAQFLMGLMYSIGIGKEFDMAKATIYINFAAQGEDVFALTMLGYRHYKGILTKKDCAESLEYYKRSADQVIKNTNMLDESLIYKIHLTSKFFDEDRVTLGSIEFTKMKANNGEPTAQYILGEIYFTGNRYVVQDYDMALKYARLAFDEYTGKAAALLGKIYMHGTPNIPSNNETALFYFQKAAEDNEPDGLVGLGILTMDGSGTNINYSKAYKHFSDASVLGSSIGYYYMAYMHQNGLGVKMDRSSAFNYYTIAARNGHIQSIYNLGKLHILSHGILGKCEVVVELMKLVAERHPSSRILHKAHIEYNENNNIIFPFMVFTMYAELGYSIAQSNLAYLLMESKSSSLVLFGSDDIKTRAFHYLKRAADQEDQMSNLLLGDFYFNGIGTSIKLSESFHQYIETYKLFKNAQAAFNIGYMYEHGYGIQKDIFLAKRNYDISFSTSMDSQVPAFLANLKLSLVHGASWYLKDSNQVFKFIFVDYNITLIVAMFIIVVIYKFKFF